VAGPRPLATLFATLSTIAVLLAFVSRPRRTCARALLGCGFVAVIAAAAVAIAVPAVIRPVVVAPRARVAGLEQATSLGITATDGTVRGVTATKRGSEASTTSIRSDRGLAELYSSRPRYVRTQTAGASTA
jgi:hypothetical protein